MLGYLKKFNELPPALKQKVSTGAVMATIEALERKYNLALASLVMKVMVKEVLLDELAGYLVKAEKLNKTTADQLAGELKAKIFLPLGDYFSPLKISETRTEKIIQPPAPVSLEVKPTADGQVKGASFFFSADDEAEIRELAKKIEPQKNTELPAAAIAAKLDEIISLAKINFGSTDLAERFNQILKTYLRGIRNRLETKATLVKPFLSGGLSFDEISAEQVMVLANKVLNSEKLDPVKPFPKINIPAAPKNNPGLAQAAARDAAYDFSKLKKKIETPAKPAAGKANEAIIKKIDVSHELAPLTPAIKKESPAAKPVREIKSAPQEPVAAPHDDSERTPLIKRRFEAENTNNNQRVRLSDVKYVPKVMGPLDEVKYFDLVNFRRLDKDPQKAINKIRDKIELLAEDGYDKKLAGIKVWRLSPVNKLYLQLGHLSISENKPVDVIIEERKMKNEEYLTAEEFKAVMDLNKSLRF